MADFIILFKYESEEHPRKIEANFQELRFLEKTTPYSKSAMLSTLEYIPSVNLYSLLKEDNSDIEYIEICVKTESNVLQRYERKHIGGISFSRSIGGSTETNNKLQESLDIQLVKNEEVR